MDGIRVTRFKIISDYVICGILAGAIGLLYTNRLAFDANVLRTIIYSLILSIATGLAFTLYSDPFGVANAVGHFLQIGSFYLIYRAFVETVLTRPQDIFYRNLKQSKEEVLKLNTDLEKVNLNLMQDIKERKAAEEALKESEERFNQIFRSSPVAKAITRVSDGTFVDINDNYERLMGFTQKEVFDRETRKILISTFIRSSGMKSSGN